MLTFLSDLINLPWEGAKIIAKIVVISTMFIGSDKIKFTEPQIKIIDNEIQVQSTLINSFTKEIEKLLKGATPIIINNKIIIKSPDKESEIIVINKEFEFNPFNKKFYYYHSFYDTKLTLLKIKDVKNKFENLQFSICLKKKFKKYKTLKVIIQANVSIKKKVGQLGNVKLWKNKSPTVTFKIKAEKLNGN